MGKAKSNNFLAGGVPLHTRLSASVDEVFGKKKKQEKKEIRKRVKKKENGTWKTWALVPLLRLHKYPLMPDTHTDRSHLVTDINSLETW